jgi:Mce-associated membrane protein
MSAAWKLISSVSAMLAMAGIAAAGWFGYAWWSASRYSVADTVAARDGALSAARQLVVTLQSVDPAQPEQGMRAWQAAATGALLERLRKDQNQYLEQLKKTPMRSRASVLDAALTDLDAKAGTATAIAALDVTQTPIVNGEAGKSIVRQLRVKLTMNRTDAGWKVAGSGLVNA